MKFKAAISLFLILFLVATQLAYGANSATPLPRTIEQIPIKHNTGHIEVEVYINSEGPYLFLLDTGTSGDGRIDKHLAKKLDLKVLRQTLNDDGSGRNLKIVDCVKIDSLQIGQYKFYNLEVSKQDYHKEQLTDVKIDGVLGLGLFEELLLTIDYPNNLLKLEKGELSKQLPNTSSYNRGKNGQCCMVPIKVGDSKFEAILDTGNQGGLTVPRWFLHKVMIDGEIRHCGMAKTANNSYHLYEAKLAHPLEVSGHTITDVRAKCARGWKIPNLGHENLREFAITIDQKNQLVRFIK